MDRTHPPDGLQKYKLLLLLPALFLGIYLALPSIKAQRALTGAQLVPYDNKSPLSLLQEELKLNIRTITDESDITFTFIAPNTQKINLTIDDELHEDITSPYTIKDLSIGIHKLTFSYTNDKNIPREISINLIIVPKKPIITSKKNLFIKPEPIKITGRALPNSHVMAVINSDQILFIPTNSDGTWEFIPNYTKLGEYNMLFFSYKNGLISRNAASLKVEYRLRSHSTNQLTVPPRVTTQGSALSVKNVLSRVQQIPTLIKGKYKQLYDLIFHNPHGIWAGISILSAIGISLILIILILYYIIKKRRNNIDDFTLEELLNKIPDLQDKSADTQKPKKPLPHKKGPSSEQSTKNTENKPAYKTSKKKANTSSKTNDVSVQTKAKSKKSGKKKKNETKQPKNSKKQPTTPVKTKKQGKTTSHSNSTKKEIKVKKGKRIETLL